MQIDIKKARSEQALDQRFVKLSEKLRHSLVGYIEENYVDAFKTAQYAFLEEKGLHSVRRCQDMVICENSAAMNSAAMDEVFLCAPASLEDMLKKTDAGFTETLLKLIDRSGKKDSEVYKKANLSKQHFSKIRNNPNYRPTKPTAIALALALELSLEDTKDLIGRAGYALTNSSKFDLIIRFFIERGNYNVVEINMALYEFAQTLIGG